MLHVTIDDFNTIQLRCKDCDTPFTLTAEERLYFFQHEMPEPVRCVHCRQKRKATLCKGGDDNG